jgi:hypothetical protein
MNGSIRDCASNVKDFESGVVNRRKLLRRHSSLQGGAETNLKASYGKEGTSCTPSIQFPCASKDTQDGFSMLVGYTFFLHLFYSVFLQWMLFSCRRVIRFSPITDTNEIPGFDN